jgi:hypothetical protein
MDLTIGSINFCIGSLGTLRLSDLTYSGPSVEKTAAVATLESSTSSSSEVNSLVNIKPVECKGDLVDPLDEILQNLTFDDTSDLPDGYSCGSNDDWMSGLDLKDEEPSIFSLEPNYSNGTYRGVYDIIKETSKISIPPRFPCSIGQTSKEAPST